MFGTYLDLVPRYFSIPAEIPLDSEKLDPNNKNGPLVLGTLLESLANPFEALNEGPHRVKVEDKHVEEFSRPSWSWFRTPLHEDTHRIPYVGFNCSTITRLKVTCDRLAGRHFYPDGVDGYIGRSLDSEPIKKWLDGKNHAELYMITGFEVAYGLRATATTELDVGSRFGSLTRETEHEIMPKMQNGVIVSYRARKFTLTRRNLFNCWKSRDLDHGDWMIQTEAVLVGDDYDTAIKKLKKQLGPSGILFLRSRSERES
ncbi:unnamed protein product [Clonostachys rosea]|uniref:Uncharacterized protein n=1 Tax=Bionectria ochroleuca TaxID=29856 RepID=A0ABY6UIJ3_BIOOC|nr:unnamed protein product [Clonostachys rosea]